MNAQLNSPSFPKVDGHYNFPALDERVQAFWDQEQIFEASVNKEAPNGTFVFYEGPPTANNLPHMGHVLTRVVKDLFPRYRTMRGYKVLRKAGWDTHGLPVEIAIEKKLGFEGKEAIEKYGVGEFNKQCFENVRTYEREWAKTSKRVGFWLNYDDAYFTFTNKYIESVWWLLQKFWKEGLLYQGYKVLPYCPHCGTTHSSHEVAQGYQDVKDPSVYVKFRVQAGQLLKGENGRTIEADGNLYLLGWTTTPWTLPSNVALAVHPDAQYRVVQSMAHPEERFVIADALQVPVDEPVMSPDGKPMGHDLRDGNVLLRIAGSELEGLLYEPLFAFAAPLEKKAWRVVVADYVTLTDGTGMVHQAPAYGQDDYQTAMRNDLPVVMMVDSTGRFVARAGSFAGLWFKDADPEIIADLKKRGLLLRSQKIDHSYPHCWRHDTPLFYFATSSWFIRTTAVKEQLVANNQKINWLPSHIRDGRFGNWLENVVDWAISRKRYWGTPLPIWICRHCGQQEAIGSFTELFERSGSIRPKDVYNQEEFNPHRPQVDALELSCTHCQGRMKRVEEVIDCWFDAGAMPYAQHHYPFENPEWIDQNAQFPADFISEAIDQTRGWFYTLHAISTLLKNEVAYKNCIVLGHILDEQGRKMSKRLGNVVDPRECLETLGADTVRWYFFSCLNAGQSARFSERLVRENAKNFLLPLWNAYSFFTIYANIDRWKPGQPEIPFAERDPLDRWILTRLQDVNQTMILELEQYHIQEATRAMEQFIDNLNNWYIRRSRRRFWSGDNAEDKSSAYQTLHYVLCTVARLVAPFTPFFAEELYQNLERPFLDANAPKSVHLQDYPAPNAHLVDTSLDQAMVNVMRVVTLGHSARNLSQVRVRQPLRRLTLVTLDGELAGSVQPFLATIHDELNVKTVEWAKDRDAFVNYQVKPNFRKLGPRFGKSMPQVKEAVESANAGELARALEKSGTATVVIAGVTHTFSRDELEITIQQLAETTTAADEGLLAVLDTRIDERLRLEGLAREVTSRIQSLRKSLNLEYTARIQLSIDAGEALRQAIEQHAHAIADETLASSLQLVTLPTDQAGLEEQIDGERLALLIQTI